MAQPARPTMITVLDALIALHADLERDSHLPLVDVPSGINLDERLVQLAAIIERCAVVGPLESQEDRARRVKAAFAEGYNAMRRQYHLLDVLDLAWEQSVSKQALG